MSKQNTKAIILASGRGSRFENDTPKQFLDIKGCPVLIHSLRPFQECDEIDEIIIVTIRMFIDKTLGLTDEYKISKIYQVVEGGKTRQESSKNGIDSCGDETKFVLIHDAVRPFVSNSLLNRLIKALNKYDAIVPVIPSADTIVETDQKGLIINIPNRLKLWRVQTPQAFRYEVIKRAHAKALEDGVTNSTDDSSLVLRIGHPVYTIKGDEKNIKITYPTDFQIARKIFES